jgi:rsbT co-antagonist protein RsbR
MARSDHASTLPVLIEMNQPELLNDWLARQLAATTIRRDLISESQLREQSSEFLAAFANAARGGSTNIKASEWTAVRDLLAELSRSRARQGFTPTETATFVLSLKQPLFSRAQQQFKNDTVTLAAALWDVTEVIDALGLHTTDLSLRSREDLISRQQREMLELSTPVVQLWDGVLALPLIGTLDSERTQIVMENLLQRIVETGAEISIIDITGVPTVDTLVAQHLLKTVAAARLMGADCIISGIRPQIAQTIVHLGVELGAVTTKATLADAFSIALQRMGLAIVSAPKA